MTDNRRMIAMVAVLMVACHAVAQERSSFNVSLFGNVDTLRGAQVNIITGVTNKEMRGVSIAGLLASSKGKAYGVQLSGGLNSIDGDMRGVQMAGVGNIAHNANGMQIAGLSNACTSPMRGIQISGITNIAMGVKRGIQLSAVANVCSEYMRGIQTAMYNYADTLNGWQLGVINACISHPRGVQVGLINYSRDTIANKVGLVNVNPLTRIDLMVGGGTSTKTNVALRFRNRSTYSIIGFGTHFMGFDDDFSGALFYRLGQYMMLGQRWSLSGDVGYCHVETFKKNSKDGPKRLCSLQLRLNVDYSINRTIGAFATVGYGDTRYYHHFTKYRQRMIGEAGLTFRLARK